MAGAMLREGVLMSEGLYLGGSVDDDGQIAGPYHLEAKDLRTHGVVVGMTGSGKTGLCLVMLEELARAGVPVIAIDPKGDLANLGLLFEELAATDFAPWVESGDGSAEAALWRKGLADWGLGPAQVSALKDQLALTVYTPGSEAGVGVDVLGALRRPSDGSADDPDTRRALVAANVSGLLGLVGRKADPVRDPAHIVLCQILDSAWATGEDPDLEGLILRLVDPPFQKVGVFPLDRFFPPDDRMDLAMLLNGVVASPTFSAWTRGAPLDVSAMLAPPADAGGRTRVSILSLAHLGEPERAFFLGLLLGRVQAWSRSQPGASGLRALLFFDEVAGWIPPHPKNPPTKSPLLTLMKQARAVGLGVVLATQNPVDIDYKGLSNAGFWAVGRLQTKQDRDRLLKGMGRPDLDGLVEGLGKRRFMVNRAKASEPVVVASRFAMCFLRGPMTATELKRLGAAETAMVTGSSSVEAPAPGPSPAPTASPVPAPSGPPPVPGASSGPPPLPPAAGGPPPVPAAPVAAAPSTDDGLLPAPPPPPGEQWFLDPRVALSERLGSAIRDHAEPRRPDGAVVWRPALYADVAVTFDEERVGFVHEARLRRLWFPLGSRLPVDPVAVDLEDTDLSTERPSGRFASLPSWLDERKELTAIQKRVVDDVYRSETAGMWVCKPLRLYGRGGESEADFRARCEEAAEEVGDKKIAALTDKVDKKLRRLEDRIARAEEKVVDVQGAIKAAKAAEMVNVGETVWALFSGRRKSLGTAMTKRNATTRKQGQLDRAEAELARLRDEEFELGQELEADVAELRADAAALLDDIEEREVRLEKNDVRLQAFGMVWVPVTRRV